jgi:hypothetical protein
MSKIFTLANDLRTCYETKYPFADDWAKASYSTKKSLCENIRKSVINYVNSSEYSFIDIAHQLIKEHEGNKYN